MSKPFSQELYNTDNSACEVVIDFLTKQGWQVGYHPDKYAIDLLASNGKENWEIEVEVKHNWQGKDFPFKDVHFSARKLKFANKHSIFIMLNSDRSYGLGVRGTVVLNSPIVVKNTIYTQEEEFIAVPISSCRLWRFR